MYKPGRASKYWPAEDRGSVPPEKPGEYWIRDNEGVRAYHGETINLNRRMKEHKRSGKLCYDDTIDGSFEWKVADGRSTSKTRREHERRKIKEHKPRYNKSIGGEGRPGSRR